MKETIEQGDEEPDGFYHDYGADVGVDVDTGEVTSIARVEGAPDQAHVIPVSSLP